MPDIFQSADAKAPADFSVSGRELFYRKNSQKWTAKAYIFVWYCS
jgi:hypothetical protein